MAEWEQVPGKLPGIMRPVGGYDWDFKPGPWLPNCHCSLDYEQEEPAEETKMKALYEFHAVNRRTDQTMVKRVISDNDKSVALSAILLVNADEIKEKVGDPNDCEFVLLNILSYEPIEAESE